MPNGNLVLSGLTSADAGVYTCVAENSLGTAQSQGQLTILREYPVLVLCVFGCGCVCVGG